MLQKCHEDPYLRKFKATVASAQGSLVLLEPNFFFCASGGQGSDRGEITFEGKKAKVADVVEEGGKAWLKIEGEIPPQGAEVECSIDWGRRYALMKAHTAEHMLFQALSRQFPGVFPEKVSLEPGALSLFMKFHQPLAWEKVLEAEKLVNSEITAGREVKAEIVGKGEVQEDVRIKSERIGGEKVRVVEVSGFDKVACSGIHVKNAGELGMFCVQRITSDRPGIWKIDFLVGKEALDFLLGAAKVALSSSQILGTGTDRLEKTVANMRAEEAQGKAVMKELSDMAFAGLKHEEKNGVRLYSRIFPAMDAKILQEWASKLAKSEKTAVIFAVKGAERAFLIFGKSKDVKLDVRALGAEAFRLMNGKGGGNEFFVSGSGDPAKLEQAVTFLTNSLEK